MWSLVVFALVIASGLASGQGHVHVQECLDKSGVKSTDFDKKPIEITKEIKCYMKCVMEHDGFLQVDGSLNIEEMDSIEAIKEHSAKFSDLQKKEIKQCLGDIGKIADCEDVDKVLKCAPQQDE